MNEKRRAEIRSMLYWIKQHAEIIERELEKPIPDERSINENTRRVGRVAAEIEWLARERRYA